jgi:hypothetical protein
MPRTEGGLFRYGYSWWIELKMRVLRLPMRSRSCGRTFVLLKRRHMSTSVSGIADDVTVAWTGSGFCFSRVQRHWREACAVWRTL